MAARANLSSLRDARRRWYHRDVDDEDELSIMTRRPAFIIIIELFVMIDGIYTPNASSQLSDVFFRVFPTFISPFSSLSAGPPFIGFGQPNRRPLVEAKFCIFPFYIFLPSYFWLVLNCVLIHTGSTPHPLVCPAFIHASPLRGPRNQTARRMMYH